MHPSWWEISEIKRKCRRGRNPTGQSKPRKKRNVKKDRAGAPPRLIVNWVKTTRAWIRQTVSRRRNAEVTSAAHRQPTWSLALCFPSTWNIIDTDQHASRQRFGSRVLTPKTSEDRLNSQTRATSLCDQLYLRYADLLALRTHVSLPP